MERYQKVSGGYVIKINDEYFLVNELTKSMIDYYYKGYSLKKISDKLSMNIDELECLYSEISTLIERGDYLNTPIEFNHPLLVQWKIINECNLRCKHCYIGEKNLTSLNSNQLMDICQDLIESQVLEVVITGGEALLVENLSDIIERLISNNVSVKVYTNAILLDNLIDDLKDTINKDLLKFLISVDGLEETHNNIRGIGTFSTTISNIKYALENDFFVTTNSVINKLNYKELPKLIKYLNSIGVPEIQISNLVDSGWALESDNGLRINDDMRSELLDMLKNEIDFPINYADISGENIIEISNKSTNFIGKSTWRCCAGISKCTINSNGDVLICSFIDQSNIGNVLNSKLNDIWNSDERLKHVKIIQEINKGSRVCINVQEDGIKKLKDSYSLIELNKN